MRQCAPTNVSKCFSLVTKETTARSSSQDAAAKPYRPAVGQDPETAELRHRGRGRRGELRAVNVIHIFKENHSFSEEPPHPGPRSIVGAANPAAAPQAAAGAEPTSAVGPSIIGRPSANIPKRPNSAIAGGVGEAS